MFLLDRETGEPLIGMTEREVPQDERQFTAASQPIPVGEPFMPQTISIPPEGYTLPFDEHVFPPFWLERVVGLRGGAEWPGTTGVVSSSGDARAPDMRQAGQS